MKAKLNPIRITVVFCIIFLFILTATPGARAADEEIALRYRTYETNNLRIFYGFKEQEYILKHMGRCFENSWRYHRRFFDYTPSEKVTIYFNDNDDFGYAGTTTIPNNWLTLGIEPFEYVYDTCPTNERMNWVMNHELLHVVASDQAVASDKFFRTIFFGKVSPTAENPESIFYSYLTNPRRYAPRWYHEGVAVFMETWMAGGMGRSLTGYDEMTFRAMVHDESRFYDLVGLESEGTAVDFQIGQKSYLYGTRFVSYLAFTYGPEKVIDWIKRDEGSGRYFSTQFTKVYGRPLHEEWSKWIEFEHDWQRTNLDSIRQYAVTPFRRIPCRPLGSVSREFFNPEKRELYVAVNYPGEFSHIASIHIDTGKLRKICEIPTPALYYVASLAYDQTTSTLFYTTDNSRSWRDVNACDIRTGKSWKLLNNIRTGDLAFNRADKSIWGMQHHNGKSRIVRIPAPYNDWQEVLVLQYGKDMFDIDISPDGRYLTGSLTEVTGRQQLIRMDIEMLLSFDAAYEVIWEFEDNTPENFVYSPDGRYLFGTSYYTGVSNVFRYDFVTQKMEALSNAEIGYFRPIPISEDSLIAFEYTGGGFLPIVMTIEPIAALGDEDSSGDIAAIQYLGQAVVDKHPIVRDWILGSPAAIDIDSLHTYSGAYKAFRSLGLVSAYPIIEGYKNYGSVGAKLNFMDPVGINGLDFAFTYTINRNVPEDERPHIKLKYQRFPWTISGAWNLADFYDLFGPTKISRKGYQLDLTYENFFVVDRPRALDYTISLAGYWDLEQLPFYQNVETPYGDFYTANAHLDFKSLRKTIGGIEKEKGIIWRLGFYSYYILSEFFPLIYTNFDYGLLLPIDHSSLWLRTSFGYSFEERDDAAANFYFGGFGNNYIDHQKVNRYRSFYSFPGVELNAIGGTNYAKAMLEWTLPPIRFEHIGFPAIYGNWMRFALFTTGIVTNIESEEFRRELIDVGVQMNLKLVLFSSLESTFSIGYAGAFEEGEGPSDEFMISLKILR